jgi:hypothetical protein
MNANLSADSLRRAASVLDQIERLRAEYTAILGGTVPRRGRKPGRKAGLKPKAAAPVSTAPAKPKRRKKRKLSAEARARIVAAVKARWARVRAGR